MTPLIIVGVLIFGAILFLSGLKSLLFTCSPNEVLIISGRARREGNRIYGYRLVKGGYAVRWPIVERVDRMDLTNMVIDVSATNAYCKGGIPLTVQGVANVKIAGHEPVINNAIERFLGRSRDEVMRIAKATLEGSLRGILSTMTPEESVSEQKRIKSQKTFTALSIGVLLGIAVWSATHGGFILPVVLLIVAFLIGYRNSQNMKRIEAETGPKDAAP